MSSLDYKHGRWVISAREGVEVFQFDDLKDALLALDAIHKREGNTWEIISSQSYTDSLSVLRSAASSDVHQESLRQRLVLNRQRALARPRQGTLTRIVWKFRRMWNRYRSQKKALTASR